MNDDELLAACTLLSASDVAKVLAKEQAKAPLTWRAVWSCFNGAAHNDDPGALTVVMDALRFEPRWIWLKLLSSRLTYPRPWDWLDARVWETILAELVRRGWDLDATWGEAQTLLSHALAHDKWEAAVMLQRHGATR